MLTSAEITAWIGQLLWPMFRITSALWMLPIFGGKGVPKHTRLALAGALTFLIAPQLNNMPVVDPLSPMGIMVTLEQLVIGLSFAFIIKLLFTVFTLAGQMMSMQMGLSMAVMNDPSSGSTPVLGSWLQTLVFLLFLSMEGHLVLIRVLLESFHTLPIGSGLFVNDFLDIALMGTWMFSGALLIAMPSIFSMLLVNLCFGVMSRAASQLNIFALGFPMTMMFGMITLFLVLINIPTVFSDMTEMALMALRSYLQF